MNEQSIAIFNAMNEVYEIKDVAEAEQYSKKLRPHLSAILATIKETVLNDSKLFNAIFVMNFSEKKKIRVMCEYLGINEVGVIASNQKEEILKFCASTMTYESLAELYPTIKILFGITRKEFLMAWMFLSKSKQIVDVFFAKKHENEDLSKDALSMLKSREKENSVKSMLAKAKELMEQKEEKNEG